MSAYIRGADPPGEQRSTGDVKGPLLRRTQGAKGREEDDDADHADRDVHVEHQRQLALSTMKLPRSGPATVAIPNTPDSRPIGRARVSAGR